MIPNSAALVAFYRAEKPDDRGRYLHDILAKDDAWLEYTHDYIQWLFPIRTVGVNLNAPPADDATVEAFHADAALRASLRWSFARMLSFYGLRWKGDDEIVRAEDFERKRQWLSAGNHNYLRLTRIMTSLRLLGDADAASALYRCLLEIDGDERAAGRESISSTTLAYWEDAIRR